MKKQPSQEDRDIGKRIRQMRDAIPVKANDLAKRLDVTRGAVGNWERGQGIKRENLQKIASYYGVNVDWLLTGRGSMSARRASDPRENIKRILAMEDITDIDINEIKDPDMVVHILEKMQANKER